MLLTYSNYNIANDFLEFRSGAGLERMGLGTAKPGEIGEGDDEFDQYRKRMMLAYRFRPNPMVGHFNLIKLIPASRMNRI